MWQLRLYHISYILGKHCKSNILSCKSYSLCNPLSNINDDHHKECTWGSRLTLVVSTHCTIGFNYDNYDFFLLWIFTLIIRFIHVITFHILNLATRCICMRTTWVGSYLVVFGFENDFPSHKHYILLLFLYLLSRLKCCHK